MKEYLSINTSRWIYTSNKTFALTWRRSLSYRNQSIDLLRRSMGWFLYDRVLRHELRRSSSIILQNSALTSCKAEFAFCFLFLFLSGFSFTNIHDSQDSKGRGKLSLYFFSTTSTCFSDISRVIAAESSPFREQPKRWFSTMKTWSLFCIFIIATQGLTLRS